MREQRKLREYIIILVAFTVIQLLNVSFCSISTWSQVNGANAIASAFDGDLYVSSSDNIIYELYQGKGTAIKYAGTGEAGLQDGDVFEAKFNNPKGLFINREGDIFVCDYGNNAIRRISKGQVDTIVHSLPSSPISITSWDSGLSSNYWNDDYYNPVGFYVTTESGDFYFVDFGPSNDDCNFAEKLDITTTATAVHGTTEYARSRGFQLPDCAYTDPSYAYVWYTFTGNGNEISLSVCSAQNGGESGLYIYSELSPNVTTNTCGELLCIYSPKDPYSQCSSTTLCSQADMIYYVVVSVEQNKFTLTTQDVGAANCSDCSCSGVECGLNDCLWQCGEAKCAEGTICIDSKCEKYAKNAFCDAAIALPSANYSFTANTILSPLTYDPNYELGFCVYPRNPGLWYSFVGTGDMVTVSLCSSFTDFDTILHVYSASSTDCDELECMKVNDDSDCMFNRDSSIVTYCSQEGVTYYYLVEGYEVGAFELIQTLHGPCTPGYGYDNYYNYGSYTGYYYYFSSYYVTISNYYYYYWN